MPAALCKRAIIRHDAGLGAIESLAAECRTSLTASAIRYAELTDDAVAVVISTGPVIDYCFLSGAMKSLPHLTWLRKGSPVPREAGTWQLSAAPDRVVKGERLVNEIDVMDWLGGRRSAIVNEEVVGLGRYGKILTILSSTIIGHEDDGGDDDDDDAIAESWTPRFRR